jgi:hypothetical protein
MGKAMTDETKPQEAKPDFDLAVDVAAHRISSSNRAADMDYIKELQDQCRVLRRALVYIISQVGPVLIPDKATLAGDDRLFDWRDESQMGTMIAQYPKPEADK